MTWLERERIERENQYATWRSSGVYFLFCALSWYLKVQKEDLKFKRKQAIGGHLFYKQAMNDFVEGKRRS